MSNNQLSSILAILMPKLIKEIMVKDKISESEVIDSLYGSKLYSALENEETKLWHLSEKALYELYKQEKTTGTIEYPREQ